MTKKNFAFNRELFADKVEKKINDEFQTKGIVAAKETQRFFKTSKFFKISITPVEKIEEVKIYLDKKKYTSQKHEQGIIIFYPNTEEFFEKGDDEEYFENERVAIKNFLKGKNIVIIGKGNKGQYKFNKKIENASTGIIIVHAQNVQIANQIKSLLSKIKYAGNKLVEVHANEKEVRVTFDPNLYKKIEIQEPGQSGLGSGNSLGGEQAKVKDNVLSTAVEIILRYGQDIFEVAKKIADTEQQVVFECFERFFQIENLVLEREGIKRKKDTMTGEPGNVTFMSQEISNEYILQKITEEIRVQYGPKQPEEVVLPEEAVKQ